MTNARLPVPGQDENTWGEILNTYLKVAHEADGTLKQAGDIAQAKADAAQALTTATQAASATIADLSVTKQKLSPSVQASIDKADAALQTAPVTSVNGQTGAVTVTKASINLGNVDNTSDANKPISLATQTALGLKADVSSLAAVATTGSYASLTNKPTIPTVADATSSVKGIVQLAGDLAGTAASPAVSKINGVTLPSSAPTAGQVLTATNATTTSWSKPVSSVYINVKDYGALGDGSSDDVVAIQAAIDAANAKGGGTVFFPAGIYIVGSTFTIYSYIYLRGEGITATTIKLKNNANTTIFQTYQFSSLKNSDSTNAPQHFGWEQITFDGNKANNTTSTIANIYGSGYFARNFEAINGATGGIYSEWGQGGTDMEAHYSDFKIHECLGTSLDWKGPHDSTFLLGEVFSLNGRIDTAIRTSGNAAGEKFIGMHTWGSLNYGFKFEQTAYCFDSTAEGARNINVLFLTGHCTWTSGQVYGAMNAGEVGMQIGDNTHAVNGTVIRDVRLYNFDSTGTIFNFSNSASANLLSANVTLGSASAAYTGIPNSDDRIEITVTDNSASSVNIVPGTNTFRGNSTYSGSQMISPGAVNQAYTVRAPGADIFNVNTGSKWIEFPNSSYMYFYSGAYSGLSLRIKGADGTLFWGANGDTSMTRSGVATLAVTGRIVPTDSITLKTKAGVPVDGDFTITPPDGTLAYNSTNATMYIRANGTWQTITAGVQSGGSSTLAGGTDVSISNPGNNQVLTYSTSLGKWTNSNLPATAASPGGGVNVPIQYSTPLAANATYVSDPVYSLDPTVFGSNPIGTFSVQIRCTQPLTATLACSATGSVGSFTALANITPSSYAGALMGTATGPIPQDMPYLQLTVNNGSIAQGSPFGIHVGVTAAPTTA